jgi:redox-sensitive bicupin YhaK (pirin superfamily)
MASVTHVPANTLFVSEPPPEWFGNGPNPQNGRGWSNSNWVRCVAWTRVVERVPTTVERTSSQLTLASNAIPSLPPQLKSRFHTNFAEYSHGRPSIGVMRVCNDDLVQPARGFGTHPHRDAEIATYIVAGNLTHKDSMGTSETLGPGSIQFMTAGQGIQHSEFNASPDTPLRFIQMWFTPRRRGLTPNYGSYAADGPSVDGWTPLVGDVDAGPGPAKVKVNTDVNLHASRITAGSTLDFELGAGRQAYVLSLEHGTGMGTAGRDPLHLEQHDAALVTGPTQLRFTAPPGGPGAHVLLIERAAA